MRLIFVENVNELPRTVDEFLGEHALENNICLGVLASCRENPTLFAKTHFFYLHDGARIRAYAHYCPPYPLCLSLATPEAAATLARSLSKFDLDFDRVYASKMVSENFFAAWPELEARCSHSERHGLYRLDQVIFPKVCRGSFGEAQADDLPLLIEWHQGFCRETGDPLSSIDQLRELYQQRLASRSVFVLREGAEAVSMASATRDLGSGRVISFVYTPPKMRRRGYAAHLVAALSARLLAQGYEFCCLFTQLANATSNKIYQDVGYRFAGEFTLSKLTRASLSSV